MGDRQYRAPPVPTAVCIRYTCSPKHLRLPLSSRIELFPCARGRGGERRRRGAGQSGVARNCNPRALAMGARARRKASKCAARRRSRGSRLCSSYSLLLDNRQRAGGRCGDCHGKRGPLFLLCPKTPQQLDALIMKPGSRIRSSCPRPCCEVAVSPRPRVPRQRRGPSVSRCIWARDMPSTAHQQDGTSLYATGRLERGSVPGDEREKRREDR